MPFPFTGPRRPSSMRKSQGPGFFIAAPEIGLKMVRLRVKSMHESLTGDVGINKDRISSKLGVRVGCAGWSIPREDSVHFVSVGSHLNRYAQVFKSCEINSSFSRSHKRETWERWARSVPDEFRFSVKAPRAVTHEERLSCSSETLAAFLQQIRFLRDKLGPVLIQLPPSLEFDHRQARQFLSVLRQGYAGDVVWEPRHASWFDDRVDDLFREFHIARVAADPGCVPVAGRPSGLASLVYFRLHGSPRRYYSAYRTDFLNKLSEQLAGLASAAQVWCIFDNTASGAAIKNALELSEHLRKVFVQPFGRPLHR
jgi:uncharacterized protein YecE (DUF72 family)